ncbi:ParM/StbA family protein [Natroniella acetigena]|uniref:ParM/StbA family protein n=1 Tax=Natroniella acetigena TaxID=52004 RepID=UPI00200A0635|nr:ParM/StbA family protein [Natroniella acetigena]MCK8828321.1 ParM/StbA family protein [Natroniella acetigena]
MRIENVNVLGVDLGYDSIKMLNNDQEVIFPSLAEKDDQGVLSETSFQVIREEDELIGKFDPKKIIIKIQDELIKGLKNTDFTSYRVGNYVLNQHSSSVAYSLSDNKYEDPEEFAKLLSGICLLFPKADKINIKHLITGLPIKYYENHKDLFKNKLENEFKIKIKNINNKFIPKEIEIRKATVIPQGLASYYDFIMNKKGLVTKKIEGGFGIVDLGGLTIDCVAFNDGELIKDSPISFSDGVKTRIFKKIQDSLDIDISQDIIKNQILEEKDYIKVRNEKYEFKRIKEQAIDKLAYDIALQIKNRWESYLMIDKILITGGATVLLFESLDTYLEGFPCERVNKNPQLSNCRGYVKLGKALERKRHNQLKEKAKERKLKAVKNTATAQER